MKKFVTLLEYLVNNKERAIKLLEQFNDLKDKFGDIVIDTLDSMDDYSRQLFASVSFELIEKETISLEFIKEHLSTVYSENSAFKKVALLKLGYNNKLNVHEFAMQFLDENSVAIKNINMVIIQGKVVEGNLHKAFGDKELLIIK